MDLKSGDIFWPAVDGQPPALPPLEHELICEVAVIGAGITGALVADRLSRDGRDVIVLDRRSICNGSTPASTGLLQYEIDTPLVELTKHVGADHAKRAYLRSYESIPEFEELIAILDDDCGLTRRRSLYLACEPDDAAELRAECDARREIGIDVEYLSAVDLRREYSIERPAALRSSRALDVDPYRLALSLLRRADKHLARIFPNTAVVRYEPDASGVTLHTSRGLRVRARHVVFGTGYETPEFFDQKICACKSTYALASQPLDDFGPWQERCLIWESGDPYFYCRTTPDGRAMIGGEDDDFSDPAKRDARIAEKTKTLLAKFKQMFPSLSITPAYTWAGTFAETKDGLPYIGTTPQFPRGYFALGYGGNGITFSLIAAGIIADLIAGRRNEHADLFRFDR